MADRSRAMCPGCNEPVPVANEAYWPHFATRVEQVPPLQVIVDLWPCEGSGLPMRECRVCGCTELDCSRCIARTGKSCSWVEDDLCSACHVPGQHVRVLTQEALRADGPLLMQTWFGGEGIESVEFENQVLGQFIDKEDGDAGPKRW